MILVGGEVVNYPPKELSSMLLYSTIGHNCIMLGLLSIKYCNPTTQYTKATLNKVVNTNGTFLR